MEAPIITTLETDARPLTYEQELTLISHLWWYVLETWYFIPPRLVDSWLNAVDDLDDLRSRLEEARGRAHDAA